MSGPGPTSTNRSRDASTPESALRRATDADADPSSVWEIYNLHVTPVRRGGGIGSRLFAAAVTLGRERRARDLTLWVVDRNVDARRFYEHKGMIPDGAHQVHTVGPGAALAEVRYRLQLTRP